MNMKNIYSTLSFLSLFVLTNLFAEEKLPLNYRSLSGCEKQSILWQKIEKSKHKSLPEYSELGLPEVLGLKFQSLYLKGQRESDIAPKGWKKYLHKRGAVAKVKIVPIGDHNYTGIFKGAECGILRLSLTFDPAEDEAFSPGLALKVLRDGVSSANVSALYALKGQERNFNFFTHPLSNIVPTGESSGEKIINWIFKKQSSKPEELAMTHMAAYDAEGKEETIFNSPSQIFFSPSSMVDKKFSSSQHDVRKDFLRIKEGTHLYTIYALKKDFNYENYKIKDIPKFLSQATPIAEVITTSAFVASEFGDTGIFFRHQFKK